jgi:hypothetical protein
MTASPLLAPIRQVARSWDNEARTLVRYASPSLFVCAASPACSESRPLCAAAKILQVWFGWRASQGQPRMCITVGGKTLRLAGKDATVMEFNREGRDGFPVKVRFGVWCTARGRL